MSAERGWIGEPQPQREWHSSRYARMADKIYEAEREASQADKMRRAARGGY